MSDNATSTPPPSGSTPSSKPSGRIVYRMRVVEVRDYTSRIRELFLQCEEPREFKFRCGQFVMLHVPAQPKALLRAYSIASDDRVNNGYRLIFNHVENGAASNFVWTLKGGEILDFTGPFGRLFFKEPPSEQLIMLSTGSGISQHYSYIASNLGKYSQLKYRILIGVRTERDIYYNDELDYLKAQCANLQYEFVLSRPSEKWMGKKGYVQDFINEFGFMKTPTTFYLCGNGGMIKDVKSKLSALGFDSGQIFAEAFD